MKTFTVSQRKNEFGEWVVRCWENGKRRPEADYFTESKHDAFETCKALTEAAKKEGTQ